jgi:hypothetical protein
MNNQLRDIYGAYTRMATLTDYIFLEMALQVIWKVRQVPYTDMRSRKMPRGQCVVPRHGILILSKTNLSPIFSLQIGAIQLGEHENEKI